MTTRRFPRRASIGTLALLAATLLALPVIPVATAALTSPASGRIAAGEAHSCAVTSTGGVKCWGNNDSGQLGNGSQLFSRTPVNVSGLTTGVRAITAGNNFTCALTTAGAVKCWGDNQYGELGDGSTSVRSSTPVNVASLSSGVTAIAAGRDHTCAVTSVGGVMCWGANTYGDLGHGTGTGSRTPVDVVGLTSGVMGIAAGLGHTCALTTAGGVKCWGGNYAGELGNGSTILFSFTPVDVVGLSSGVTAIASHFGHTCAITSEGGVKCWGGNKYGALGNGSTTSHTPTPVAVSGLTGGFTAVAVGWYQACAMTTAGGVKCWGNDGWGQLGNGAQGCGGFLLCRTPVDVIGLSARQTISVHPSRAAGTIARGKVVTFSATVKPLQPAGSHATVRFELYRKVSGLWKLAVGRSVIATAAGTATLRWTFSTAGSWYLRARALANPTFAASAWSSRISYTVH